MEYPPNDDMNIEEEVDDSSVPCETVQDISCNHETKIKGQVLRGVSKSLPIKSSSKSSQLSEMCMPICNQASKPNQRALSTPCLISSTETPSLPSSSLIQRILRESFSKLLTEETKFWKMIQHTQIRNIRMMREEPLNAVQYPLLQRKL